MRKHHNGCAIYDDGQCTCDALPYPRDTARSAVATPAYLQIDWLERRVKELEAERDEALARCETLRGLADAAAAEQGLAQRRMIEAQRERHAYKKAKEENDERFMRERDEARAEVERLRSSQQGPHNYVHKAFYEQMLGRVAERQREACAAEAYYYASLGYGKEKVSEKVRATPLVTEGKE